MNETTGQGPSLPAQLKCSVRGCSKPLDPESTKKMCDSCREKHRAYGDAKRARRKAEKALIIGLADGSYTPAPPSTQVPSATATNPHHPKTLLAQYPELLASLTQAERAKQAVANANKAQAAPPQASTSNLPPQTPPDWRIDPVLLAQSHPVVTSSSTLSGALGHPVGVDASALPPPPPSAPDAMTPALDPVTGKPRYCSVKGCKTVIIQSVDVYPYKMCLSCRDRYRIYGITKREKGKAKQQAQNDELNELARQEDARRAAEGLPPLAESPEALQAYQQSVLDQRSSLPVPHQTLAHGKPAASLPPPDPRFARPTPGISNAPLRVCSVSHCHQILAASYRFKRCEVHRVQNRWHSLIKRGREKIHKGMVAEDGTILITPGPIRKGKETATEEDAEIDVAPAMIVDPPNVVVDPPNVIFDPPNVETGPSKLTKTKKETKDRAICKQDDCCNLILPGTRWRTCAACKAKWTGSRMDMGDSSFAANDFVSTSQEHVGPSYAPPGHNPTSTLTIVDQPMTDSGTPDTSSSAVTIPVPTPTRTSSGPSTPAPTGMPITAERTFNAAGATAGHSHYTPMPLMPIMHLPGMPGPLPYPYPAPALIQPNGAGPNSFYAPFSPYMHPPGFANGQPPMMLVPVASPYAAQGHGPDAPPVQYYALAPVGTIPQPAQIAVASRQVPIPTTSSPDDTTAGKANASVVETEPTSTAPTMRECASQTCRRRLPVGAVGLCEKCKIKKIKRRQAATKQRLHLEPKRLAL